MQRIGRAARAGFALCVSLAVAGTLSAQGAPPAPARVHRLTLDEGMRLFALANLQLRAAGQEVLAARARAVGAGAFSNPVASATQERLSDDGRYRESLFLLGQTFEVGGQRGLRRNAAALAGGAAEARFGAERQRLAFEVGRAYVNAARAESALGALADATEVFRRVEESGSVRFAEGDPSGRLGKRARERDPEPHGHRRVGRAAQRGGAQHGGRAGPLPALRRRARGAAGHGPDARTRARAGGGMRRQQFAVALSPEDV